MLQIFVFDIDGTLTSPRKRMDFAFSVVFRDFCIANKVFLCTGSDFNKVLEQVPEEILSFVDGIFTCSGNSYWFGGDKVGKEDASLKNDFVPPPELIKDLQNYVKKSNFHIKTANFIEFRTGMINFSTVGRACDQETREIYSKWDQIEGERVKIVQEMSKKFPELDFNIGGEISIDIHPNGWDKGQAIRKIKGWYPKSKIHFFGDKMNPGGNDHAAVKSLSPWDQPYPVKGPEETKIILKNLLQK